MEHALQQLQKAESDSAYAADHSTDNGSDYQRQLSYEDEKSQQDITPHRQSKTYLGQSSRSTQRKKPSNISLLTCQRYI